MTRFPILMLTIGVLSLSGCSVTPAPDYRIAVTPAGDGHSAIATPPACPNWSDNDLNFFDNQPLPQFGCANARNLAIMVDQPNDLFEGRDSGPANAVTTAGAIVRYNNSQPRGLVDPAANSSSVATSTSVNASTLNGESLSSGSGASASPAAGH